MPNEVFDNGDFQSELAKFLSCGCVADSGVILPPPVDQQYVNEVFNHVLRSLNRVVDVSRLSKHTTSLSATSRGIGRTPPRVTKHIRDHVHNDHDSWRRSPLWLLIRVAIQLSIGHSIYKSFVLFFMCTLARDESNTNLSSDFLHLMSSTILRRTSKLGSSIPNWLSKISLKTWTCLLEILDVRWKQLHTRLSPFQNPSSDELARDTQLSLPECSEYIRNTLADHHHESIITPFRPNHRRRGTIEDFLSSDGTFFDEAYAAEPDVTLYDVERLVEECIDGWVACVRNADEACAQLELLMDKYSTEARMLSWCSNPEHVSIMFLTVIELYVALDKLVVKEIPMLADYPPPFPIALLENLLLRSTMSLHRLSCAYRYLFTRHSQSRPGWSAISDEFTADSFPVRYYDQSLELQQLKARIEEDSMKNVGGSSPFQRDGAGLTYPHDGY